MTCGAALTGARSATATSGPGFSLMTETLGWAGMAEIPVVVTLYQRGGPSTGMPSRTEQGDLLFAIHAGHGEFPRLVLASGDLEDCFQDAARALDYADRFQVPVIHLLDKALASTTASLPPFSVEQIRIDRGKRSRTLPVQRFAASADGVSPRPLVGRPGETHWLTGCEHGADGRVSEDPVNREAMLAKRARKLETAAMKIPAEEKLGIHGDPRAALTLLTWGSTTGAAREAVERLCAEGRPARLIQVRLLWPFPAAELEILLDHAAPLVVAECNFGGQLASLLNAEICRPCDHLVVKFNGRPFSGEALYGALAAIADGRGKPRMEIHHDRE
jgi:2-oxoglutarate ferredoxin oxidoreductase subunit alpha